MVKQIFIIQGDHTLYDYEWPEEITPRNCGIQIPKQHFAGVSDLKLSRQSKVKPEGVKFMESFLKVLNTYPHVIVFHEANKCGTWAGRDWNAYPHFHVVVDLQGTWDNSSPCRTMRKEFINLTGRSKLFNEPMRFAQAHMFYLQKDGKTLISGSQSFMEEWEEGKTYVPKAQRPNAGGPTEKKDEDELTDFQKETKREKQIKFLLKMVRVHGARTKIKLMRLYRGDKLDKKEKVYLWQIIAHREFEKLLEFAADYVDGEVAECDFNELMEMSLERDMEGYETVVETRKWVRAILAYQNISPEKFLADMYEVLSKKTKKVNSFAIEGGRNAGKSLMIDMFANAMMSRVDVDLMGENKFAFERVMNQKVIVVHEANITPEYGETMKRFLEGDENTPIHRKGKVDVTIERTIPLLLSSNDPLWKFCPQNRGPFMARMKYYSNWQEMPQLKQCGGKLNPHVAAAAMKLMHEGRHNEALEEFCAVVGKRRRPLKNLKEVAKKARLETVTASPLSESDELTEAEQQEVLECTESFLDDEATCSQVDGNDDDEIPPVVYGWSNDKPKCLHDGWVYQSIIDDVVRGMMETRFPMLEEDLTKWPEVHYVKWEPVHEKTMAPLRKDKDWSHVFDKAVSSRECAEWPCALEEVIANDKKKNQSLRMGKFVWLVKNKPMSLDMSRAFAFALKHGNRDRTWLKITVTAIKRRTYAPELLEPFKCVRDGLSDEEEM